jgi:hypothetical protein
MREVDQPQDPKQKAYAKSGKCIKAAKTNGVDDIL